MFPDDNPGRIRRLLGGSTPNPDNIEQDVKNAPSDSTIHLDGTHRRLKVNFV